MSHTFKGKKTVFIFNSDLSGCIRVRDIETGQKMNISGEDLMDLLIEYEFVNESLDRSPYEDPNDE